MPGAWDRFDRVRTGAGAQRDAVREKTRALVDASLDRVFHEPLEVPDVETALRLLADDTLVTDSGDVTRRLSGFAVVATPVVLRAWRMVRPAANVATKVTPAGRGVKVGLLAVPATVALWGSARLGVHELQVLASLLVARLRAEGLPVERGLVRAVTVSTYLHPGKAPDLDLRMGAASTALGRSWVGRAVLGRWQGSARKRDRRRVDAIAKLDLAPLVAAWRGRTVIDV